MKWARACGFGHSSFLMISKLWFSWVNTSTTEQEKRACSEVCWNCERGKWVNRFRWKQTDEQRRKTDRKAQTWRAFLWLELNIWSVTTSITHHCSRPLKHDDRLAYVDTQWWLRWTNKLMWKSVWIEFSSVWVATPFRGDLSEMKSQGSCWRSLLFATLRMNVSFALEKAHEVSR